LGYVVSLFAGHGVLCFWVCGCFIFSYIIFK